MRAATLLLLTLAFTTALSAGTPLAAADIGPPEYIGGYCGWHWHEEVDLAEGEYPHYHYHHCI